MASNSPKYITVPVYLSDYTRKHLMTSLKGTDESTTLSAGLKHVENYTVPLTLLQARSIEDARKKDRTSFKLELTRAQLERVVKIDKKTLALATVKPPVVLPDLDSMTLVELARLHEDVVAAMARKVMMPIPKEKPEMKKGPLIDVVDYPCDISYNESLYCNKCKKRTSNDATQLIEVENKVSVKAVCCECLHEKTRRVTVNKEIEEGRISFL